MIDDMRNRKHRELTKDLVKLGLAFTPLSNIISIIEFIHKWMLKKHVERGIYALRWSFKRRD
jgi:hypothetical protein